ncbi:hypothetical protein JQ760_027710 (plasmid) [Klebsiella pneumoniae]|uniref:hypothetical protein n=1 Tax=Klebsiella pneumoniae TaxID=573 RepID=UPI001FAD75AE|nr:hypothetical protein [Klebsiella pneumoniae]MCI8109149.1 hypothetical protein [Klebsiella pneumoniae]
MNDTITEGINAYLASLYINMPLNDWTPKLSYLVCRGLVDNGILQGKTVIGVLRERYLESYDEERPAGYSVRYSNYAWIDTGGEVIFDPCRPEYLVSEKYIFQTKLSAEYFSPINPLTMTTRDLPTHYNSEEIYPVRRGLHKEVFSRLLGFRVEVNGLTMTEAAYLSAQPLNELGENAKLLYEFLIKNNLSKLLLLQNVKKVFPQIAKVSPQSFRLSLDENF